MAVCANIPLARVTVLQATLEPTAISVSHKEILLRKLSRFTPKHTPALVTLIFIKGQKLSKIQQWCYATIFSLTISAIKNLAGATFLTKLELKQSTSRCYFNSHFSQLAESHAWFSSCLTFFRLLTNIISLWSICKRWRQDRQTQHSIKHPTIRMFQIHMYMVVMFAWRYGTQHKTEAQKMKKTGACSLPRLKKKT